MSAVYHQGPLTLGSLEGDGGEVVLGFRPLQVGTNNLNTVFGGQIQEPGRLTKVGTGTLSLTGANMSTGATSVAGGTLGGSGSVAGTLIVGSGTRNGGTLAPAAGTGEPATFTSKKGLSFQSDATYGCLLASKGKKAKSDQVVAKGVRINGSAQFALTAQISGRLRTGTVFTAISNTSATPIRGTFANLADGSIITAGRNKLQVSYTGGDGNDLTLTVVP